MSTASPATATARQYVACRPSAITRQVRPRSSERQKPTAAAASTTSAPAGHRAHLVDVRLDVDRRVPRPAAVVGAGDATDVHARQQDVVVGAGQRTGLGRAAPRRVPLVATGRDLEARDALQPVGADLRRGARPRCRSAARRVRRPRRAGPGRCASSVQPSSRYQSTRPSAHERRVAEDPGRAGDRDPVRRLDEPLGGADPEPAQAGSPRASRPRPPGRSGTAR